MVQLLSAGGNLQIRRRPRWKLRPQLELWHLKRNIRSQPIPRRPLQKKQLGAICRGGYRCVKPPSATSTQTGLKGFRALQEACGSLPNMCCAKRAKFPNNGAEDFSTGGSSAWQEGGCSENTRRCWEQRLRCSWGSSVIPVYPRTTARRRSYTACDCLLKNVDGDRTACFCF